MKQRSSAIYGLLLSAILLFAQGASAHEGHLHDFIHQLNTNFMLHQLTQNDLEGYNKTLSGGEYSYPSIRNEVRKSLITRASTGTMAFTVQTSVVPANYSGNTVTFAFISDSDLSICSEFDISVGGKHLLTFQPQENGTFLTSNNVEGSNAEFTMVVRDENSDGRGIFRLTMPTSMVEKGKAAEITFCGKENVTTSWFMIFKSDDLLDYLHHSATVESSFSIKQHGDMLLIDGPLSYENREFTVVSDGKESAKVRFKKQGELVKASATIPAPSSKLSLKFAKETITISFPNNDGVVKYSEIVGDYIFSSEAKSKNGWRAVTSKLYRPSFGQAYEPFKTKNYADDMISIMNSSHQDIAWMDNPGACIIDRDTMLITPILRDAFIMKDYGFDIEDGLMIREYMERHPESKEKIAELLERKLLSVGATYNCPYEDMYDGEDLVRQFYLGKLWVKNLFNGYDSKVYWNVDVPGKTMQFPQLMKKAGVDYMIISRHARGLFYWQSPDGSSVFTYSPGHYGEDLLSLEKNMNFKLKYAAEQAVEWDHYFENSTTQTPLLSSQDMLPAIDYGPMIEKWNATETVKNNDGEKENVYLPKMELMTVDEYMPLAAKNATKIDTIYGERPNVWLYIHGPSHHYAVEASRNASKLLPAAEKFLTVANIIDPKKMPYPYETLDKAWQDKIYPDHGWGGHDGDITDDLFKESYVRAEVAGNNLLNDGVEFIASRIKTKEKKGSPLVVFNSLSWERTDPVEVELNFEAGEAKSIEVIDAKKQNVASQVKEASYHTDGTLKQVKLVFIAENMPSIGYKTYYYNTSLKETKEVTSNRTAKNAYENDFYSISFSDKGIEQIRDKELGRDLFKTDGLKVGDVFTLESAGNGAGEFSDVQQPTMTDFDVVSAHNQSYKIINDGPLYTSYSLRQEIREAVVEQTVTVYHSLKRIYFDTKLKNWTGKKSREFRTAFPLAMDNAKVMHEVPFGTVTVGESEITSAGERYTSLCKEIHPRAIMDWIAASDNEVQVTVSSSVAAADWVDPTDMGANTMLQHILLASRTSCHWEGNEYSQAGDHDYRYVLTSTKAGETEGQRIAEQANEHLKVVLHPDFVGKTNLPEQASFFSIDQDNVQVTTVKKAEDANGCVIRMYDADGVVSTPKVSSYFSIDAPVRTNLIEEVVEDNKGTMVPAYGIETFRFSTTK